MSYKEAIQNSRIEDINANWWGITTTQMMEKAGENIAKEIIKEFGKDKSITIISGLGNNGGDGITTARYLSELGIKKVTLLLIGREQDIKTDSTQTTFYKLKELCKKKNNLEYKQDSYFDDINPSDIVIESLLGIGIKGKVYKRFGDCIKRISKMKSIRISIDLPVKGYKPDKVYSISFEKYKDSKIIDIGLPNEVKSYVGPGQVRQMHQPEKDDYKTQTGELFVFGGSDTFHGAPLMSIMAASKFIGTVYFYTTPGNRELVNNLKSNVFEFITVNDKDIEKYAGYADAFLFGPGLEDNLINRSIIEKLIEKFPHKPKVLDAYAIAMAPEKYLKGSIITPHRGELRHIWKDQTNFKTKRLESNLRRYAVENQCTVILKGHTDIVFHPSGEIKFNLTGNPGMAKGGTGDILSGMIASFLTKNDTKLSSEAGIFISGLAGDMTYKEFGYNYSATDIVKNLQKGVQICNSIDSDIDPLLNPLRPFVIPNDRA